MVKISIIIPTLNEETYLPKLLESIKKQSFKDYEIIIGDAGSTDNTKKIAKKYGAKIVKGGMPAVGRNSGAKHAKGEFLFFFDADVKIPKNFLKDAYEELEEKFIDLATCEFRPLSNLHIDKVMHDFANISIKLAQYSKPHAPGFCIFTTKRLFDRVEGFDETITLAEDHEFIKRASQHRPLKILNSVKLYVSIRRLRKEGRLILIGKYLHAEAYRILRGELRNNEINYEFSNFKKNDKKFIEKKLRKIESDIIRMNQEYNKLKNKLKDKPLKKALTKLRNKLKTIGRVVIKP
jgi:glycosyltransferase involved in cell wall biosynthesis